jgi:predicted esterase
MERHLRSGRVAALGMVCATACAIVSAQTPAPRHLKPFYEGPEAEDVADFPNHDLRAGGNPDMRYSLIGPGPEGKSAPADGYKLLLVLPGGEGSPDFNPFVRRIAKNALGNDYLTAQLVAPEWDKTQGQNLVWPTRTNPYRKMKFATEDFIGAVVKDIGKAHKINPKCVYALGWSSGGPPVYASLLSEKSPLTGAFVAMSVFQPANLPPLAGAKGKAVYLLHSPQDFIKIAGAEAARDGLAKHGAATVLTTYAGGHGWREDPFGHIERGMQWLVAQTTRKQER